MADPPTTPTPRRLRLTPGHLMLALLAIEGLLFASDHFRWLPWHKGYAVLTAVGVVMVSLLLLTLWFTVVLVFRVHFQFSLRSLLLLVVVVALPCSWLATDMTRARKQQEVIADADRLNMFCLYDWEVDNDFDWMYPAPSDPSPTWLRKLLGNDFFWDVVRADFGRRHMHIDHLPRLQYLGLSFEGVSDADFERVTGLGELRVLKVFTEHPNGEGLTVIAAIRRRARLHLRPSRVTDVGLKNLEGLTQLRELDMGEIQLTDDGLAHFKGLKLLQKLTIRCDKISGSGFAHLKDLRQLQDLTLLYFNLSSAQEPDARTVAEHAAKLEHLTQLRQLRKLTVHGQVTPGDISTLQRALPNCEIMP